jgi:hypothetical protein
VLIAPVSARISLQTGNFSGKLPRFGISETPIAARKRYMCTVLAQNPYTELQGILIG